MDILLEQLQDINFFALVLICIKMIGAFYLGYFIVELPLRVIVSLLKNEADHEKEIQN